MTLTLSNLFAWSLQVAAVVGAALIALRVARPDAASIRYVLLRVVLLLCLALPFVQPYSTRPDAAAEGVIRTTESAVAAEAAGASGREAAQGRQTFAARVLFAVILCGMLARLLFIGLGIVRLRHLRRAGEAVEGNGDQHRTLPLCLGL